MHALPLLLMVKRCPVPSNSTHLPSPPQPPLLPALKKVLASLLPPSLLLEFTWGFPLPQTPQPLLHHLGDRVSPKPGWGPFQVQNQSSGLPGGRRQLRIGRQGGRARAPPDPAQTWLELRAPGGHIKGREPVGLGSGRWAPGSTGLGGGGGAEARSTCLFLVL